MMLTPLEICEQLTTDEFIVLCQALAPIRKFEVIEILHKPDLTTVVITCSLIDSLEVDLWPISA
jgi:hypothetical protein